jgi:hypothetical protein
MDEVSGQLPGRQGHLIVKLHLNIPNLSDCRGYRSYKADVVPL